VGPDTTLIMSKRQNQSHVHHFTPRSVLRRFSLGGAGQQVMVFDKSSGRSWSAGLTPTGSAKGYNTIIRPDGARLNFEADFDAIDLAYAKVGDVLAQSRSVAGLEPAFRTDLADSAAAQFLRTPIIRSSLAALPRDLTDELRANGLPAPADDELPDENAVRQISRNLIHERAHLRDALLAKDLLLFTPTGAARYWTSDHPIVHHSNTPLGERGFESLGVEIYLPIASDLMLGFLCPSLLKTPTRCQIEDLAMPADKKTRLIAQRQAMLEGTPLAASDEDVAWFNSLQVAGSSRFLYAADDAFELAHEMLEARPELRLVERMFTLGGLGEGPPRPGNLPPGEWLCLEGTDRWARIPIAGWRSGSSREMWTDRPDLLADALTFAPFITAHVFAEDGSEMMRGVALEILETGPPTRFRLRFADTSLQALDALIAGRADRGPEGPSDDA
jgi:hypothetical protein